MRRLMVTICLGLALAACSDRGEELYETARFEEQQFNPERAREIYRQIIDRYPESPWAEKAKDRLEVLPE